LALPLTSTLPTQLYPPSLHDALPIYREAAWGGCNRVLQSQPYQYLAAALRDVEVFDAVFLPRGDRHEQEQPEWANRRLNESSHRSEEHTSELQSRGHLVCRLLLEKKK